MLIVSAILGAACLAVIFWPLIMAAARELGKSA